MRALADEISRGGSSPSLVRGDLSRRGEAKRVVNDAAKALGGLDVLINNAGGLGERRPLAEIDDALFDFVYDLNVRAVLAASTAAMPHFEKRGGGNIINVGSIAGIDGGGSGASLYSSAKAAVHNLTRHLANDLAGRNIRVNTVAPGAIATPFHAKTPAARMDAMRDATALGRVGVAEDCVGSFLFLASNSLSGYITGNIVHVNGGMYMP
jgi:3-oxoacyl-[acyl-carrier protein] reductase